MLITPCIMLKWQELTLNAVIMGFVTHSLWSLSIISLSLFCSFKRFFSMSLLLLLAVFLSSSEIFCALRLCSATAAGLESISPNTGRASEPGVWGAVSEQRCSLCKPDANRQKNTKIRRYITKWEWNTPAEHTEWNRTVLSRLVYTAFKVFVLSVHERAVWATGIHKLYNQDSVLLTLKVLLHFTAKSE